MRFFRLPAVLLAVLPIAAVAAEPAAPGGPPGGAGAMMRFNADPQDAADAAVVLGWAALWEGGHRVEAFEQYTDHAQFHDHARAGGNASYVDMIAELSRGGGPGGPGGPGGTAGPGGPGGAPGAGPGGPGAPGGAGGPSRPNPPKSDDPSCKGGGGQILVCGAVGARGVKRVVRAQRGIVTLYWEGGVEVFRVQGGKITDHWDASPPADLIIKGPDANMAPANDEGIAKP